MRNEQKSGILLLATLFGTLLLIALAARMLAPELESPPIMRIDPTSARRFPLDRIGDIDLTGTGLPQDLRVSLSRDADNRSAIVGWFDFPGDARRFVIANGLGYLATGVGGLHIIDIDDPRHLRVIGSEASNGMAWDLVVSNKHVFLTANGLQVVDVSQPESPRTVATLPPPEHELLDLAIAGNTLYAGSAKGLHIYDITEPTAPRHVRTIPFAGGPWALHVKDDLLLLSCYKEGRDFLDILDISQPHAPKEIESVAIPSRSWGISLHDHYAYLPIGRAGIAVIDIATPKLAKLKGIINDNFYADFITFDDNRAYCASRRGDFNVFMVNNPTQFERIGEVSLPPQSRPVILQNGIAFVANSHSGLLSIDVTTPRPIERALILSEPDEVVATLSDGEWLYLAGSKKGLYIARRSRENRNIAILSELPVESGLHNLARIGTTLCALARHENRVLFIDISNPLSPRLVGSLIGQDNEFHTLVANDRHFILGAAGGRIFVVDAQQPSQPNIISSTTVPGASRLLTEGDRLYVAGNSDDLLTIIDLATPETPRVLSRLGLPWPMRDAVDAYAMAIADGWLVISVGNPGLLVFDVSRSDRPKMIKGIDLGSRTGALDYANERLYVTTRAGDLWVLKKGRNGFVRTAATSAMGKSLSMQIDGDEALLANGTKGLAIVPLPQEVSVRVEKPQRHLRLKLPPGLKPGDYRLDLITGKRFFPYIPISIVDPEQGKEDQKL